GPRARSRARRCSGARVGRPQRQRPTSRPRDPPSDGARRRRHGALHTRPQADRGTRHRAGGHRLATATAGRGDPHPHWSAVARPPHRGRGATQRALTLSDTTETDMTTATVAVPRSSFVSSTTVIARRGFLKFLPTHQLVWTATMQGGLFLLVFRYI